MAYAQRDLWRVFQRSYPDRPDPGLETDHTSFPKDLLWQTESRLHRALAEVVALRDGGITGHSRQKTQHTQNMAGLDEAGTTNADRPAHPVVAWQTMGNVNVATSIAERQYRNRSGISSECLQPKPTADSAVRGDKPLKHSYMELCGDSSKALPRATGNLPLFSLGLLTRRSQHGLGFCAVAINVNSNLQPSVKADMGGKHNHLIKAYDTYVCARKVPPSRATR